MTPSWCVRATTRNSKRRSSKFWRHWIKIPRETRAAAGLQVRYAALTAGGPRPLQNENVAPKRAIAGGVMALTLL